MNPTFLILAATTSLALADASGVPSEEVAPARLGETRRETAPAPWKDVAVRNATLYAGARLPRRAENLEEARKLVVLARLINEHYVGEEYQGWFLFSLDVKSGCFPQRVFVAVRKGTTDVYEVPYWRTTW